MDRETFGICSECQSRAPVREVERYDEYSDDEFIMSDHDAWGKGCNGSGTTPEVILGT
jgi:hypothetical protein